MTSLYVEEAAWFDYVDKVIVVSTASSTTMEEADTEMLIALQWPIIQMKTIAAAMSKVAMSN